MSRIVLSLKTIIRTSFCLTLLFACSSTNNPISNQTAPTDQPFQSTFIEAVDGSPVAFDDFNGEPTVLWFWTPFWRRCQAEASTVAEVQINYSGEVNFIGIAGRNDLSDIKAFITSYNVGKFPHLFDSDGDIWSRYGVSTQPAWGFIDTTGETIRYFGSLGKTSLQEKVEDLLSN